MTFPVNCNAPSSAASTEGAASAVEADFTDSIGVLFEVSSRSTHHAPPAIRAATANPATTNNALFLPSLVVFVVAVG